MNHPTEQTVSENLEELKAFLYHIEGRVGEQAFNRVESIITVLINHNNNLNTILKSDSVYTILRFASKNPSGSGVDDCEEERYYYDLYNMSCELRKK